MYERGQGNIQFVRFDIGAKPRLPLTEHRSRRFVSIIGKTRPGKRTAMVVLLFNQLAYIFNTDCLFSDASDKL